MLTLPKVLQATVNADPRIAVADRNIGMADGRRQQANAMPNPTVGFEVDNFTPATNYVGGAGTTLMLSQLIELGGKRDAWVSGPTDSPAVMVQERAK